MSYVFYALYCTIYLYCTGVWHKVTAPGPVGGLYIRAYTYKLSFKKALLCICTYIRNPIPGGGPPPPPFLPLPKPFLCIFYTKLLLFNDKSTDKTSVIHEIGVFLGQFIKQVFN